MPPKKTDESPVFQLKVTLKDTKPPIWRRIQVRGSTTLYKLNYILQTSMGWTNSHLHQFTANGIMYGEPDPDWFDDVVSERRVKLGDIVAEEKDRFLYEYDFGDGWEHLVVVEKVLPPEAGIRYPRCLKGRRTCPPEDVGGTWGYYDFLDTINDPQNPDREDMLEWIGGDFDPDDFDESDVEEINSILRTA